jgi:hypothetical protein
MLAPDGSFPSVAQSANAGHVLSQDGVCAGAVFSEMANVLHEQGLTVYQHMQNLYNKYGHFVTQVRLLCLEQAMFSGHMCITERSAGRYIVCATCLPFPLQCWP